MSRKRYNIGLIVGDIEDDFSDRICLGAMQAAGELDANLFIFPAKYLREDGTQYEEADRYEYQYNTLLKLANNESLDYILLALSSVGFRVSNDICNRVLKQFDGIPVILLSTIREGYTSIVFDNQKGVRQGLNYWIKKGIRKIGMITSDLTAVDAKERYDAYCAVLSENGIEVNPDYVLEGDYSQRFIARMRDWYKENSDVEAVFCSSDTLAERFFAVLRNMGVKVGKDVFVFGYDDIADAVHMNPPLATVKADPREFGYLGMHEAVDALNKMDIDVKPEIREIRVDTTFVERESASGEPDLLDESSSAVYFTYKGLFDQFTHMNHLMNTLHRDIMMFKDLSNRDHDFLRLFEVPGVHAAYFFRYRSPMVNTDYFAWNQPKHMYLTAYKKDGEVTEVPTDVRRVRTKALFNAEYMPTDRHSYIIMDIFSQEKQYGVFMCDLPHKYFHFEEEICYLLGTVSRMRDLMETQQNLIDEKDMLIRKVSRESAHYQNLSKQDMLTELLNRRGFYSDAEDMMHDGYYAAKQATVYYIDLNYLKKINDTYGHDDGDFAICKCADAMRAVFRRDVVLSRFGGDEFVVLSISNDDPEEKVGALKNWLAEMNREGEKPFCVEISVGYHCFAVSTEIDMEEMIEQADIGLYQDKIQKTGFHRNEFYKGKK